MELVYLCGNDHATAAAENLDMTRAQLAQLVDQVFKILDMPALIGANSNGIGVFLNGRLDNLLHRSIVREVYDLGAACLQNPAHNIDRRVVAVEKARCGDKAERVVGCRGIRSWGWSVHGDLLISGISAV